MRLAIVPLVALTVASFHSTIRPVPAPVRAELKAGGDWQQRCPVSLTDLRVLTVTHWGLDDRVHTGQLIVNKDSAAPLARVFHRLYDLRFSIRHLLLADAYGLGRSRPADNDISGSFECREAIASPCSSTLKTSVTGRCNVGFALHGFAPISHVPAERLDIPDRF